MLLAVSFVAGMLTILAPCILPVLPVVIGSAATKKTPYTPYIVIGSLAASITLFTLLLKISTLCVTVTPVAWSAVSGIILCFFGVTLAVPGFWAHVPGVSSLYSFANKAVGGSLESHTVVGDILLGASLGPIFSSCSPTYFVILATVLPVHFWLGALYVLMYVAGLSATLIAIVFIGERTLGNLLKLADEHGWFKRSVGIFFIVLGIAVATQYDKVIESYLTTAGFRHATQFEQNLLEMIGQ